MAKSKLSYNEKLKNISIKIRVLISKAEAQELPIEHFIALISNAEQQATILKYHPDLQKHINDLTKYIIEEDVNFSLLNKLERIFVEHRKTIQ